MHAAVFDLDGTLIDSADDIAAAFRAALVAHGRPAPSHEEVRALIGRPLPEMLARYVPAREVPELVARYRMLYWRHCADQTRLMPGVRVTLTSLRADGWRLAVATTKRTDMARRVSAALGVSELVDYVQGTDDLPDKPAPDVVLAALDGLGTAPSPTSWMIGDTTDDLEAGRAAGLSTAGVATGAHEREWLETAGPRCVVDRIDELVAMLTDTTTR
ncbi:HAD family hydrolase [Egibacter rhizosphaerae]|uniref:HAD family hydrolase n=1 Tax=Egibacter rhizosphaerae TaxID=1670831 RepID=A0A411YAE6_9ACTN|nr:HAD-IA family hydrolase [Egibacter rhizosphaerae]QBI18147.1 HAD family hydrolase [Egibacter rhizosphaerae]